MTTPYLPLTNGEWACRCAFQAVASKHVVGWHIAAKPEELATTALQRAFLAQPPTPQLVAHPSRGGQYCGKAYRKLPRDHQAVRSQGHRGDCYGNARAESRWFRLKTEVLEPRERPVFADLADAQASVADYLTTTSTSGCTPALATRYPITLIIDFFKLLP